MERPAHLYGTKVMLLRCATIGCSWVIWDLPLKKQKLIKNFPSEYHDNNANNLQKIIICHKN